MPDIGFLELLLIGAIAFLILGPERTPEFFAQIGRMIRKGREWMSNIKQQIDLETKDLKEPIQTIQKTVQDGLDDDLNTNINQNNDHDETRK